MKKNKEDSGLNTENRWGRPLRGTVWLVTFGATQDWGLSLQSAVAKRKPKKQHCGEFLT